MRGLALAWLGLALASPVRADVVCPRVVSEHNADVSDLARFRRFERWRRATGGELAVAIWQYLCDAQTGLYHMGTVNDGADPWSEYSTVRDPIKLLNVYNVGYCGIFGPVLDGVFHGVGFERGRAFGVSGWNHCTTEVWYEGGWHYLDLDVRGALMKPDGTIASLDEARSDRALWLNPERRPEPFFPNDPDKARVFEIYRDSRIDYFYRWFQLGHTMDFRLRQGESLTRWWRPQGGRWHHRGEYDEGFLRELLRREPRGYKSNHRDFSVWSQGNGLWRYAPDLTSASDDFADGVWSVRDLRPGPRGLELASAGEAEAVFEVFTPWIIVPKVGDPATGDDDTEAAVLRLDAARPVTVSVSLDHGKTWTAPTTMRGEGSLDLTADVKGTYGYLVALRARGEAGDLVLRRLSLETWVQVAPISLPRLKRGVNRCRYEAGDRYGQPTLPMLVLPNVADPRDLARHVVALPEDYDLERRTARIRGDVVLRLDAAPGTKIAWFTAGACFTTHQREGARRTDNRIAWAAGRPEGFEQVYEADVPTWVNHWRYQWDEDVRLDEPADVVFVRYTGDPGVNVLRATVHLTPRRPPQRALRITHGYRVGGRLIERTVDLGEPGDYTIEVEGEPDNAFVRLAVPSRAPGRRSGS